MTIILCLYVLLAINESQGLIGFPGFNGIGIMKQLCLPLTFVLFHLVGRFQHTP